MIKKSLFPVLYVLCAAALFAAGAPLAKVLLESISPLTLAAILYSGSAIGLSVCFIISRVFLKKLNGTERNGVEAPLTKSDVPWLMGSVFFGSILSTIILMVSLQYTPAVTASMLLCFEAVASTTIAATIFHEPVGRRVWAALGLITLACLGLTYSPGSEFGLSLGAAGVILTCICWGIDCNLGRKISSKDPLLIVLAKGWGAGIVIFLISRIFENEFPPFEIVLPALFIGFMSFGGLMMMLYFLGLRGLGAARASSIFGMSPIFGVVISFMIFRDITSGMFFIALPLMAGGLYLLATEKHSHLHTHPAETHEHRHCHDDLHHDHGHFPADPDADKHGYHSHPHTHSDLSHTHPHRPDIHHRHRHDKA
ncbi:DMT family transporter [Methanoplanus sp. FWC-SCC4]|uniref:DMT family transporter n=1 Tax=Methanochimaera problematica TaxID=2609417 RepID=A0AA97FE13_9EURY|nr:DMT family transporter [Methanoplanus sp. FWC-SCC4]WOF17229.1 DMT family transporter [Methanoplanus sp. FWC-SCC4]